GRVVRYSAALSLKSCARNPCDENPSLAAYGIPAVAEECTLADLDFFAILVMGENPVSIGRSRQLEHVNHNVVHVLGTEVTLGDRCPQVIGEVNLGVSGILSGSAMRESTLLVI
ncbi:MAG: hypothetical protein K8R59_09430, partial [Thermoanaerobaculales bacterium]|nr:hypothetical protein [Thermoanaerobaculales bacterium]